MVLFGSASHLTIIPLPSNFYTVPFFTNAQSDLHYHNCPLSVLSILGQRLCEKSTTSNDSIDILLHWYSCAAALVIEWQFELSKLQSMRASCYCFCPIVKYHLKSSLRIKILLWLMMTSIHYNYCTTPLEKREKIIALWTSGSKQAHIAEEVG